MKKVIKKTGIIEDFDENKLIQSLINVGTDEIAAGKICKAVYDKIPNLIRADDLWKITLKELKKYHLGFATKYNLKKAIYNLGPSGFLLRDILLNFLLNMDMRQLSMNG
jgi:2-phosphoglycerate kinase